MNDKLLLDYYLSLRDPEAGLWNLSPQSVYLELETRDFMRRNCEMFDGMEVCNIGIGAGDWDDYLGYLLHGKGNLTSIDIDQEICSLFTYRQAREKHPNSSKVCCENILESSLPDGYFDLVTIIGSTVNEIGNYNDTLENCFRLLKNGGYLIYMDFQKYNVAETFEDWVTERGHWIEKVEDYERFKNVQAYMYKVRKNG